MCSEHVHLVVPRRCGTNVLGLWDSGGALLRSVKDQRRLHFEATVCRAAPCTASCCPPLRKHSRCSCTHPCTHTRTLCHSGGVLFVHTAEISNCCLCSARRWDMKRQLQSLWWTTPSQCSRYVAQRLPSRCWMCRRFACRERVCRVEAAAGVRARARAEGRRSRQVRVMD